MPAPPVPASSAPAASMTTIDPIDAGDPVELERELEALGQGFSWHLDNHAGWGPCLPALRAALARAPGQSGSSPLMPEGALVMAGRLSEHLPVGARVLTIDTDPHTAEALVLLGHEVTALVPAAREQDFTGALERYPTSLQVEVSGIENPAPLAHEAAFAGVLVDAIRYAEAMIPLLSQALWSVEGDGIVAWGLHPQQRAHARGCLQRLPATLLARHDESVARAVACSGTLGPRLVLSDFPTDEWILRREEGELPIPPRRTLTAATVTDFDPAYERHGTLEVHDLTDDSSHGEALAQALRVAADRVGVQVVAEHGKDSEHAFHRFAALAGGGHLAAVIDRRTGVLNCETWHWTPLWESALCSAFVDHLPRRDGSVHFSTPSLAPPNNPEGPANSRGTKS